MMKCVECNNGPPNGPAIFRLNPAEMPSLWICEKCAANRGYQLDADTLEIVMIINEAARADGALTAEQSDE